VLRYIAKGDALVAGHVVEQLPFVLRQICSIRLEKRPPNLSVQGVELFGLRLVRHSVQF
jgi:hypothetical protein